MVWQVILTIWILIQMFAKIYRATTKIYDDKFLDIVAAILWAAGMISCLYFGGFYNL